jgi:glyoxylase-like metal-dependent hydrolase (beta-lactamase superfamily II)
MPRPKKIWERVYQIGGPEISHPQDCMIFLVDVGNSKTVLIDCGSGKSFDTLLDNMEMMGYSPKNIKALILTHCHIDHIGAASQFKSKFNPQIIAHEKDADAIQGKNNPKTAASWYRVEYSPVTIDHILLQEEEILTFGDVSFNCIHTPGHTPGSISILCEVEGKRILFGQDIHGPFDELFESNIGDWKRSMEKLLNLRADIMCEGHFGIYQPEEEIRRYILGYLRRY